MLQRIGRVLWVICGALVNLCGCEVLESMRQVGGCVELALVVLDAAEVEESGPKNPQYALGMSFKRPSKPRRVPEILLKPAR